MQTIGYTKQPIAFEHTHVYFPSHESTHDFIQQDVWFILEQGASFSFQLGRGNVKKESHKTHSTLAARPPRRLFLRSRVVLLPS